MLAPGGHLVYSDFHPSWAAQRLAPHVPRTPTGRRVELAYFPHTIDEHLAALEASPLAVRAIREPRIRDRPAPVVVVFHAVKPGIAPVSAPSSFDVRRRRAGPSDAAVGAAGRVRQRARR